MSRKRKYQICYLVFPDADETRIMSNYLVECVWEKFSISSKEIFYNKLTKQGGNQINNYLQNNCILVFGYLDAYLAQNCYLLGLAHAQNRPVILINLTDNPNLSREKLPSYIRYNFIVYTPPIVSPYFKIKMDKILDVIIKGEPREILYYKAVEFCSKPKYQTKYNFYLEELDISSFSRALTKEKLKSYFDLYLENSEKLESKLINIVLKIQEPLINKTSPPTSESKEQVSKQAKVEKDKQIGLFQYIIYNINNYVNQNFQGDLNVANREQNISAKIISGSAFNQGDNSVTIANQINQLPESNSEEREIKKCLKELQEVINSSSDLDETQKNTALNQVEVLTTAVANPQDNENKQKAKSATYVLEIIIANLPAAGAFVTIAQAAIRLIRHFLGIG